VRWQATADRDLHVGIDVAVSTDDRALFIQVGERFWAPIMPRQRTEASR
jgi:hypothetical protein